MPSGASAGNGRGRRRALLEPPELRPDGLQLDEDRRFQERWWTAERIAHGLFGLILVAALAGFTGAGGWFADGSAETAAGPVTHPRYARWQGSATLTARFRDDRDRHRLVLAGLGDRFTVEAVQPQPVLAFADERALTLVFDGSGLGAVAVVSLRPEAPGVARWSVALDDAPAASVTTVVLP